MWPFCRSRWRWRSNDLTKGVMNSGSVCPRVTVLTVMHSATIDKKQYQETVDRGDQYQYNGTGYAKDKYQGGNEAYQYVEHVNRTPVLSFYKKRWIAVESGWASRTALCLVLRILSNALHLYYSGRLTKISIIRPQWVGQLTIMNKAVVIFQKTSFQLVKVASNNYNSIIKWTV